MGCFLGCFGGKKDRRRRRSPRRTSPVVPTPAQESSQPLLKYPSPTRSTAPEKLTADVSLEKLIADDAPEADVSPPVLRENREQESSSNNVKKVTFDLNVKTYEEVAVDYGADDEDENQVAGEDEKTHEEGKSSEKSSAFPPNHRYQNCDCSDEDAFDDDEEDEYEDCDSYVEDNDRFVENEEESYDSFFSLQIDKEPQSLQEVNSPKPKPISSPDSQIALQAKINARGRSNYVHPVLNPVENLSQWKEVKVRAASVKNSEKENINSGLEKQVPFDLEPSIKVKKHHNSIDSAPVTNMSLRREISVDTSLSTWLVSSENSTQEGPQISNSCYSNSPRSREDRPILGALTVEDIKQSSVTSSPRRSTSKNPDEIPILGAMGTYWRGKNQETNSTSSAQSHSEPKGIPNSTSKYREDKRVNWHSIPFEVRLERALNQGAAS